MTERTFLRILNQHARAVKELSWAGGKYGAGEIEEARRYWRRVRRETRRRLLDLVRHGTVAG